MSCVDAVYQHESVIALGKIVHSDRLTLSCGAEFISAAGENKYTRALFAERQTVHIVKHICL